MPRDQDLLPRRQDDNLRSRPRLESSHGMTLRTRLSRFAFLVWALPLLVPLAQGADGVLYEGASGPGHGQRIVLLAGDEEYRSEEGLPMLAKILAARHGFTCTVLFSINTAGNI